MYKNLISSLRKEAWNLYNEAADRYYRWTGGSELLKESERLYEEANRLERLQNQYEEDEKLKERLRKEIKEELRRENERQQRKQRKLEKEEKNSNYSRM